MLHHAVTADRFMLGESTALDARHWLDNGSIDTAHRTKLRQENVGALEITMYDSFVYTAPNKKLFVSRSPLPAGKR
jgi:hypothetical protein